MEYIEIKGMQQCIPCIDKDAICIVYYCNKAYFFYTCTTIFSLIDNAKTNRTYDIVILVDSYIPKEMIDQMQILFTKYPFALVRIVNISSVLFLFQGYKSISYHLSICYRLFVMSDIFGEYKKLITMDSDMICNCDIAELYDTELGNYCMAVNYEMDERWKIRSSYPINAHFGVHSYKEYLYEYLGIKDETHYFCSGVILWNLVEIRKNQYFDEIINAMKKKMYLFPDQDLLNLYYEGKTLKLQSGWNHVNYVLRNYTEYLSEIEIREYEEQQRERKIIHFAGKKPWNFENVEEGEFFWKYAKCTPWSNTVIEQQKENIKAMRLKKRRKDIINWIFPEGSIRKKIIRYILTEYYRRNI